jgi:hypothetical protein
MTFSSETSTVGGADQRGSKIVIDATEKTSPKTYSLPSKTTWFVLSSYGTIGDAGALERKRRMGRGGGAYCVGATHDGQ